MKLIKTRVPMDLSKALAVASPARDLWADITPIARRDWILWPRHARVRTCEAGPRVADRNKELRSKVVGH